MAADVTVRFLSDASKLQSDLRDVEGATKKTAGGFKKLGGMIAGVFGGAALIGVAKDAIGAANDVAESQNKVNAVFGKSAGVINKFVRGSADTLFLSRNAALSAAGGFGNMFTQLGFAADGAADMSTGMLTLSADLASFHDADPTAVLEAQAAAFRGEYDSIQKFIPTISAATVEQRALTDTGKTSADQLTAGEKAAAAYKLMMEGAGAATGDAARTADSASNKQKRLKANLEDTSASLGKALQPAMEVIVPIIASMAKAFAGLDSPLQIATLALLGVAAAIAAVGWPVVAVVVGLAALVAAVLWVWTNWDQIWQWIRDHPAYAILIAILAAPIAMFVLIVGALKVLWENWDQIWGWISGAVSDASDWITQAWADVTGAIDAGVAWIKQAWADLKGAATSVKDAIVGAFSDVVTWINGVPGMIAGLAWSFLGAGVALGSAILEGIKGGLSSALNFAGDVATKIGNAVVDAFNAVVGRLNDLIPDVSFLGQTIIPDNPIPRLPHLASGGIVSGPTLALIGERGPEAVVPLDRLGLGTINFYANVNVTTTGLGADAPEIQRQVVAALRGYADKNGPLADLVTRA